MLANLYKIGGIKMEKRIFIGVLLVCVLFFSCSAKKDTQANAAEQKDGTSAESDTESSKSNNDVTYLAHWVIGPYICAYAEKGIFEEIKSLEPYLKNKKIYFITYGYPLNVGNLQKGFEFQLAAEYEITGKYSGKQTDAVEGKVIVAGFAEVGKITITNVFFDEDSLEKWVTTNNIKTVSE
jgi:hypothetical protein